MHPSSVYSFLVWCVKTWAFVTLLSLSNQEFLNKFVDISRDVSKFLVISPISTRIISRLGISENNRLWFSLSCLKMSRIFSIIFESKLSGRNQKPKVRSITFIYPMFLCRITSSEPRDAQKRTQWSSIGWRCKIVAAVARTGRRLNYWCSS